MSDIYHIPNDDGKTYRLKKFVEYQHEVPSTHYRFVGDYCIDEDMTKDQIVNCAFILSATYSEITTVFVFELLKKYNYKEIWEKFGKDLNFGSARKHMKLNSRFVALMRDWDVYTKKNYYNYVKGLESTNPAQTYRNIQRDLQRLNEVGRFASETFLETIVYMKERLEINIQEPAELDWENCANLTSGIYNIFYEDEKANQFDKTGKVTELEKRYLTKKLKTIQEEIGRVYPEQKNEISMFVGKICSFRNLFKNARYGGFHHDRQLGVLKAYESKFFDYNYLWNHCYKIRERSYPKKYLGEKNGWDGIRKERKKMWLKTGKTGVENE